MRRDFITSMCNCGVNGDGDDHGDGKEVKACHYTLDNPHAIPTTPALNELHFFVSQQQQLNHALFNTQRAANNNKDRNNSRASRNFCHVGGPLENCGILPHKPCIHVKLGLTNKDLLLLAIIKVSAGLLLLQGHGK